MDDKRSRGDKAEDEDELVYKKINPKSSHKKLVNIKQNTS